MRRSTALGFGALVWLCAACDEEAADAPGEADAASMACPESEAAAMLTVQNRTGNRIDEITMRACDGSDLVMFPVPEGELGNDADLTIDLPAPGCWILSYTGEGCFNDPKHQTPTEGVCGGDTHVWTASAETHGCAGGGW